MSVRSAEIGGNARHHRVEIQHQNSWSCRDLKSRNKESHDRNCRQKQSGDQSRHGLPSRPVVEDRKQACFELRSMRHGDGGERKAAAGIQRPGDLQEMVRIVVRIGSQLEDLIVARALPLDAQPSRGIPNDGVEPIDAADGL